MATPAWTFRSLRNPKHAKGRLEFGLFISQAASKVRIFGNVFTIGEMDGDSRKYASSHVPCSQSRGCLIVDFANRQIKMQLNPTCGWFGLLGKYGCSDQFKFNCAAVATEEYNCLRFSENASTGVITLRWSLTQSRMPIIRPDRTIEGSMVVVPSSTGGKVRYRGNKFPKQELY